MATHTESTQEPCYYVVNLSHLNREHKYVTFWRPDDRGYAFPLSWAGRYPQSVIREHLGYYNGGDNIAVPCSVVQALAVDPVKGDIDNDAGPVVLSNRANWKVLLANVIAAPGHPLVPVYKRKARNGRRAAAHG